jgi:hypothetical protein
VETGKIRKENSLRATEKIRIRAEKRIKNEKSLLKYVQKGDCAKVEVRTRGT